MKTFKDLEFKGEVNHIAKTATLNFENGYGISVTEGQKFNPDPIHVKTSEIIANKTYCCCVLKGGKECTIDEVPHNTLKFITEDIVTERMGQIQKLN